MEKQLGMIKSQHINKRGGKELKNVIYELISRIRKEQIIPHNWKYGIMRSIDKNGDVVMRDNYSPVTLLCRHIKFWQIFYM